MIDILLILIIFYLISIPFRTVENNNTSDISDWFKRIKDDFSKKDQTVKSKMEDIFNDRTDEKSVKKQNALKKYKQLLLLKQKYLKSPEWNKIRTSIMKRDHFSCLLCSEGVPDVELHVHHITYKNLFNEEEQELKTLCKSCHSNVHNNLGYPTKDINQYKLEYFWSDDYDQIEKKNKG